MGERLRAPHVFVIMNTACAFFASSAVAMSVLTHPCLWLCEFPTSSATFCPACAHLLPAPKPYSDTFSDEDDDDDVDATGAFEASIRAASGVGSHHSGGSGMSPGGAPSPIPDHDDEVGWLVGCCWWWW